MTKVCVYAIAGSVRVPAFTGRGGRRLTVVRAGRLSAIVAPTRRVPSPTIDNLRRYHQTIAGISDALRAVLPARFGTVMEEDELRVILRARSRSLAAGLKQVRGRVLVTIRTADAGRIVQSPGRGPETARTTGTTYLRTRAEAAARLREVPAFAPVRIAVQKWVKGEHVVNQAGVTSIYHLVTRASVPAYIRALSDAARDAGIVIAVSGPFPPYAFAEAGLI
jgi:hypothetical protein